jgi:hypothetical protein
MGILKISVILSLATFAPPAACSAQLRPSALWPPGDAWIRSIQPPCGQVRGRIIRWPRGVGSDTVPSLLAGVLVQVVDSITQPTQARSQTAVTTNAAGEFQVPMVKKSSGAVFLRVRYVGSEPVIVALDPARNRAYVVEIGLVSAGWDDPQLGLSVQAIRGVGALCSP